MSSPDAIRRLLEGEIDPVEIEDDANLYSMAERIYGTEALEEMGVSPPELDDLEQETGLGLIPEDITLPEFMPSLPSIKSTNGSSLKRRWITLCVGLVGLIGTLVNTVIGGGYFLCSVGLADFPYVCRPSYGNYKLVIEQGYTWEMLRTREAWTQPMDYNIVDILLLATFLMMTVIGLFSRKKSIHPSNEASVEG